MPCAQVAAHTARSGYIFLNSSSPHRHPLVFLKPTTAEKSSSIAAWRRHAGKISSLSGTFTDFAIPLPYSKIVSNSVRIRFRSQRPRLDTKRRLQPTRLSPGEGPRASRRRKKAVPDDRRQYFLPVLSPCSTRAQKILATIVETRRRPWPDDHRTRLDRFAAEGTMRDAKREPNSRCRPSAYNDAILCADVDALKKKTTPSGFRKVH